MFGTMSAKMVWFMAKRWRHFPCRGRMLDWVRRSGHVALSGGVVRVLTDTGVTMDVDPADEHGWLLLRDGGMKPCFTRVFQALLRKGDSVIDVGANHGYFTLLSASLVTHSGHVYAFEPDPRVARLLLENTRANNFPNVTLHHAAASNAPGTMEFRVPATASPGHPRAAGPLAQVPVVTIDSLKDEMPRVRVVKIDASGSELLVLEGMKELLRSDRPFVVLDVTDERIRKVHGDSEQVFVLLHSLGYATHGITAAGAHPLDHAPHEPTFCLLGAPPGTHLPDMRETKT